MNQRICKIATLNVRGLANSADEVAATVIDAGEADVVVVTETKLRPDSAFPHRYVRISSTVPMRDDELEAGVPGSGGLAVMVGPSWKDQVHAVEIDPEGCFITFAVGNWVVCGMYIRPTPQLDRAGVSRALAGLERATRLHPGRPVMWCGDVNGRHAELLGDTVTNSRGRQLADEGLDALGLHLINPRGQFTFYRPRWTENEGRPSLHKSILDWMAVNDAGLEQLAQPVASVEPMEDNTAGSDHRMVVAVCRVELPGERAGAVRRRKPRWHIDRLALDPEVAEAYRAAAPTALEDAAARAVDLVAATYDVPCPVQQTVDAVHDLLNGALEAVADATLGRKRERTDDRRGRWFWDREMQALAAERKRRYRQMVQPQSEDSAKWFREQWKVLDREIKQRVRARKRERYAEFVEELGKHPHTELSRKIRLINRARSQRMSGLPGDPNTVEAAERHFQTVFAGVPADDTLPPEDPPLPSLADLPDDDRDGWQTRAMAAELDEETASEVRGHGSGDT